MRCPLFSIRMAAGFAAGASALGPRLLPGQSVWIERRPDKAVALEILKPLFRGAPGTTLATSVIFASVQLPVARLVRFVADVPFAHYGGPGRSDNTMGDPYLGAEVRSSDDRISGELGVRVPLAAHLERNNATIVGIFADVDRWEAFLSDYLAMSAAINYRVGGRSGFVMRGRFSPSLWIGTGGAGPARVSLAYCGQFGYEGTAVAAWTRFTGRAVVGERLFRQLAAGVSLGGGRVRPGASVRVPLDRDVTDVVDVVFGLSLSVTLR